MRVEAAIMSAAGREELSAQTAARLLEVGLGELADDPTLLYVAPKGSRRPAVPGWRVIWRPWGSEGLTAVDHFAGKGPNPLHDFFRILWGWRKDRRALFFEDDVWACRNAPRAMAELDVPRDAGVVSFFDLRGEWTRPGLHAAPVGRPFWGAQALMFPADAVAGLQLEALAPTRLRTWDTWIGEALAELGLRVYHYVPSLVQHRGKWSLGQTGAARPTAANFPGEDFDALGPCPFPIVEGPAPPPIPPLCSLHDTIHWEGGTCPRVVRAAQGVERRGRVRRAAAPAGVEDSRVRLWRELTRVAGIRRSR